MSTNHKPLPDEVEHLLRNAELRDELEPYFDESIRSVNVEELPTPVENEFLASMLAWERAPVLPIAQWFEPELQLPHPGHAERTSNCTSCCGKRFTSCSSGGSCWTSPIIFRTANCTA